MNKSKNAHPSSIKVLASYMIYKVSGKRIVTKTARLKIDEAKRRHNERITAMQKDLDNIHLELRGWTNETRGSLKKEPTPEMQAKLHQEIKRTREKIINTNA